MASSKKHMESIINPQNGQQLIKFYFFWVILIFALHIIADWHSQATPRITLKSISLKHFQLFCAVSLTSSILISCILLNGATNHPLFSGDSIYAPLVFSCLSGFLSGMNGLAVPVKAHQDNHLESQNINITH